MKVFLTGATGFVGHHVALALANQGADLCMLVRKTSNLANLEGIRGETFLGDLSDPPSLIPGLVGIDAVVLSSLAGSLAGWGLLAILERRFARARTIWTGIAIAVLLVSFSAPISAGTATTTKFALAMMHVAVAAVLIPTLRRG